MKIKNLKEKCITCGLMIAIAMLMQAMKITCLFKEFFHIPCPGCGITRAYLSLLRLDLRSAFEYNPMFWSVPILLWILLFEGRIFKKPWADWLLLGLILLGFLINWIFRL